jgi:hypothetical protein
MLELIGTFLILLAFILVIISVINMIEGEWGYATVALIVAIVAAGFGVWFIKSDERNEKEDDEYVTIVTSDYKVLDQTQMTITDGDTVVYKKYIIKYKK